jgi:hypothetical protein
MTFDDAPHEVNETFDLPIEALIIDTSQCMSGPPTPEHVNQMVLSLATMGQLQNVLVVWRGHAYELVVGYTRALAIQTCGDDIGIKTIRAMQIAPRDVDRARAAENFARRNRTTFEMAHYFSNLYEGRDRIASPIPQIAVITGKSEQYIRGLLRLFSELPPHIKTAWARDHDQRFTFHRLTELVQLKQKGDEGALNARFEEILALRSKKRRTSAAEKCLDESLRGCGLARPPSGIGVSLLTREESAKRCERRLSRRQLERIDARLAAAGAERLTRAQLDGDTFHRFVRAVLGKVPRSEAWSIIDRVAGLASDGQELERVDGEELELSENLQ